VRGLNSDSRKRDVHAKTNESECDIICLQETKCEGFEWRFIRKFCLKDLITSSIRHQWEPRVV
jgi:exonuclease III